LVLIVSNLVMAKPEACGIDDECSGGRYASCVDNLC